MDFKSDQNRQKGLDSSVLHSQIGQLDKNQVSINSWNNLEMNGLNRYLYTVPHSNRRQSSQQPMWLYHKVRSSKYRRIQIIPCIWSEHSAMKLEISSTRNHRNYANALRELKHIENNTFLENHWVTRNQGLNGTVP